MGEDSRLYVDCKFLRLDDPVLELPSHHTTDRPGKGCNVAVQRAALCVWDTLCCTLRLVDILQERLQEVFGRNGWVGSIDDLI